MKIDYRIWEVEFQYGKKIEVIGANTRREVMDALKDADESFGYIKRITFIK